MAKSLLATYLFLLLPFSASAFTIGAVSDLHAGNNNIPEIFEETVKTMEEKGADVIIVTGDMIDRKGKSNHAEAIKEASRKTDVPVLWAKGNHDKKTFKIFSSETNYYRDYKGVRIIILDSNGDLSKKEISFLKKSLETDKDVVIAMHHPALKKKGLKFHPRYKKFRAALTPNVKVVLSGHLHQSWKKSYNGIKFEGITMLAGGKYKMIDL